MIDLNAALKELDRLIPDRAVCIKIEVWRFLYEDGPAIEQTVSIWDEVRHFDGKTIDAVMNKVRDHYDSAPADLLVKEVEP